MCMRKTYALLLMVVLSASHWAVCAGQDSKIAEEGLPLPWYKRWQKWVQEHKIGCGIGAGVIASAISVNNFYRRGMRNMDNDDATSDRDMLEVALVPHTGDEINETVELHPVQHDLSRAVFYHDGYKFVNQYLRLSSQQLLEYTWRGTRTRYNPLVFQHNCILRYKLAKVELCKSPGVTLRGDCAILKAIDNGVLHAGNLPKYYAKPL